MATTSLRIRIPLHRFHSWHIHNPQHHSPKPEKEGRNKDGSWRAMRNGNRALLFSWCKAQRYPGLHRQSLVAGDGAAWPCSSNGARPAATSCNQRCSSLLVVSSLHQDDGIGVGSSIVCTSTLRICIFRTSLSVETFSSTFLLVCDDDASQMPFSASVPTRTTHKATR